MPLPCEKPIEDPESSWKWNRRRKAQSAIIIIVIVFINLFFVSIIQYYKIIQIAVRVKNKLKLTTVPPASNSQKIHLSKVLNVIFTM